MADSEAACPFEKLEVGNILFLENKCPLYNLMINGDSRESCRLFSSGIFAVDRKI